MQLHFGKSLTTVIALSLLVQTTVGNYINFANSLRSERSNEDIYDSDFDDANLIADYPSALPSTKFEKVCIHIKIIIMYTITDHHVI